MVNDNSNFLVAKKQKRHLNEGPIKKMVNNNSSFLSRKKILNEETH